MARCGRSLARSSHTYAFYIVGTNLSFGLLSAFAPRWLVAPTGLAAAVAGFIAVYWGARVVIQFTYYDRRGGPSGLGPRIAEAALVALFLYLTIVYGCAAFADAIGART